MFLFMQKADTLLLTVADSSRVSEYLLMSFQTTED